MLGKRVCVVLVSVLIVFSSIVHICQSDDSTDPPSPSPSSSSSSKSADLNVDALIKYLFFASDPEDGRIEYGALKRFVLTLADQLSKSSKYDSTCLKSKLNKLANSLPSQHQHLHASDEKFRNVSSILVASVNSCLISSSKHSNNDSHSHDHDHDHDHSNEESGHTHTEAIEQPKHASKHFKWLAAFAAATIISVVGVFCVAVVPLLNKFCFDYLFQFLVALAIGTLTGDAMLHLIPHAFVEHHEESASDGNTQHNHASIYKGLGALAGIYVFFLIEKLMKMRHQRSEKKKYKKVQLDSNGAASGIAMTPDPNDDDGDDEDGGDDKDSSLYDNYAPASVLRQPPSLESAAEPAKKLVNSTKHPNGKQHNHGHAHHGHHGHLHSHHQKASIKTNAWMVIMGDGLHNFSDGLAIGASFANSITAGIGTTIAIFFHELPHEIGDFALLRKSGVSLKRAILFNILSSVLCFLGILLGLLIGSISFVSHWSFLFIAGVFLYISLVDMLPELSTNGERCFEFILQNFGFLVGVGIMLLIALYEHKLAKMLQL